MVALYDWFATYQKTVLNKVGGAKMKPIFKGMFAGKKLEMRIIQGRALLVSGCTAEATKLSASCRASSSSLVTSRCLLPVFSN